MVRLAHLSDVHLTHPRLSWRLRDLYTKRVTSWVNFRWLGRRKQFVQAERVLNRLMEELPRRQIDHVVFSGDATSLGFESEFERASEVMQVHNPAFRGLAIPGNHDYCTRKAASSGFFERQFAPWQQGQRLGDFRYPFAQRVGPLWLVGVNAAIGNVIPWDASGRVGPDQLARLRQLLHTLDPGPRILVVHYPICLPDGTTEPPYHGLRDLSDLVKVAAEGGVCLWLHGHRHSPYHFQEPPFAPFPVICAGSATQEGLWSYGEYTFSERIVQAVRRAYDPVRHDFVDAETFELILPRIH